MTTPQPEDEFPFPVKLTAAALAAEFAIVANRIAGQAVEAVTEWFKQWVAGEFSDDEFAELMAGALDVYSDVGIVEADRMAASLLERQPLGLRVDDDRREAHSKAAETLLDDLLDEPDESESTVVWEAEDDDTVATETEVTLPPRLERLAKSAPTAAAQDGLREAYQRHGITGYTRGLDADPCELCVWLKKEHLRSGGYIYPVTKPFHKHPGCQCVPIPVGTDELPDTFGPGADNEGDNE